MVMQTILSELKMVPGVFGGYFFHRKNGIVHTDLPPMFKETRLMDMGRQLAKIVAAGRLNFPEARDINLYFDESALVSRVIDEQLSLILLCEPGVNTGMLSMSVRLALEEQLDELKALAGRGTAAVQTTAPQALTPQQALDGPLKQPLEIIQRVLADLMGPMAQLLYEDTLEQWVAGGRVSTEHLPEFIALLAEELPDTAKAAALKNNCQRLI